jgi:hypothetical protein
VTHQLLCRDCTYCKTANPILFWGMDRYVYARCMAPVQLSGNGLIHPLLEKGSFCSINRQDPARCGPDAKWFAIRE